MTDFLNNLAARALRRQEPVRPRIASRFETPSAAGPLQAAPADMETTVFEPAPDASSTIRPLAPPFAPHAQTTPHEPDAQAPPHASARADARANEEPRARSEFRPAPTVPPHVREPATERQTPFAPAERGAAASPPPTRTPAGTLQPLEPFRPEKSRARAPEADAHASEASNGTEERVRELEGRVAALEASRADERARRAARVNTQAAFVPATTTRPESSPLAPSNAAPRAPERNYEQRNEPPHVNVTIGRVDVRAVHTPAQTPRAPAPGPKPTTLAEYLKQREGGRR